jgi:hypothetical protein
MSKGDKGVCSTDKSGASVFKTKFDTEQHAIDAMKGRIEIRVCKPDSVVYQCKICRLWHFGNLECKEKYGL